jgi:hypothetical protein
MTSAPDILGMRVSDALLHLSTEFADEARRVMHRDATAVSRGFAASPANAEWAELLIAASEMAAELRAIGDSKDVRRVYGAARGAVAAQRKARNAA